MDPMHSSTPDWREASPLSESRVFRRGEAKPRAFFGGHRSPALECGGMREGTASLALACVDVQRAGVCEPFTLADVRSAMEGCVRGDLALSGNSALDSGEG